MFKSSILYTYQTLIFQGLPLLALARQRWHLTATLLLLPPALISALTPTVYLQMLAVVLFLAAGTAPCNPRKWHYAESIEELEEEEEEEEENVSSIMSKGNVGGSDGSSVLGWLFFQWVS